MSRPDTFRLADQVLHRRLGSEALAIDVAADRGFELNEVGYRILELLQEARTVDNLVAVLVSEYEISPEACADQVSRFVDQLAADGLLERESH